MLVYVLGMAFLHVYYKLVFKRIFDNFAWMKYSQYDTLMALQELIVPDRFQSSVLIVPLGAVGYCSV